MSEQTVNLKPHHIGGLLAERYLTGRSASLNLDESLVNPYIDKIITNANSTRITVVSGLDDICNMGCVTKKDSSCREGANEKAYAELLGLQAGESYSTRDILDRIKEYHALAGATPMDLVVKIANCPVLNLISLFSKFKKGIMISDLKKSKSSLRLVKYWPFL